MSHTVKHRSKLVARVRRIKGQVEAVERALESEIGCTDVLMLVASLRGAINGLNTEVMEDHIRNHVSDPATDPDPERARGTADLDRSHPHLSEVAVSCVTLQSGPSRRTTIRALARIMIVDAMPSSTAAGLVPSHPAPCLVHTPLVLGEGHDGNKRRSWWVIVLCGVTMVAEIAGGLLFGSIALVADGLHMATHVGALLLAALAYTFASRHARDPRFTFGTGKLGDLAGYSSAIALAMISLLIGYEAVARLFDPVPIQFGQAIPIACLGLAVNVASVWLLSGGHHHDHGHHPDHEHGPDEQTARLGTGTASLSIVEDGVPPRFQVRLAGFDQPGQVTVQTVRPDGTRQHFLFVERDGLLEIDRRTPRAARLRRASTSRRRRHTPGARLHLRRARAWRHPPRQQHAGRRRSRLG